MYVSSVIPCFFLFLTLCTHIILRNTSIYFIFNPVWLSCTYNIYITTYIYLKRTTYIYLKCQAYWHFTSALLLIRFSKNANKIITVIELSYTVIHTYINKCSQKLNRDDECVFMILKIRTFMSRNRIRKFSLCSFSALGLNSRLDLLSIS